MNGLALRLDGTVLGLCGQKWWCRPDVKAPNWNQDRRPLEERESSLWHSVIEHTEKMRRSVGASGRAWYQLDRGGDSYHVLKKARDEKLLVTVRSAYDRALVDDSRGMRRAVSSTKVRGGLRLFLRPGAAKRAGHSPRRARKLSVRAARVNLRLTQYRTHFERTAMELWVVHVREKSPPKGCERLEWFLQTTVPINSARECARKANG